MTGIEAIGLMMIDEKITAARNTHLDVELYFNQLAGNGISLTSEQITSDSWEIGRECEACDGDCEITVPCPRCAGKSLHQLLENPCCGGYDNETCPECKGEGIIWDSEY